MGKLVLSNHPMVDSLIHRVPPSGQKPSQFFPKREIVILCEVLCMKWKEIHAYYKWPLNLTPTSVPTNN